jgi:hypothetical protein
MIMKKKIRRLRTSKEVEESKLKIILNEKPATEKEIN